MTRNEVLDIILTSRVIAVIRMSDAAKVKSVAEAVGRGGVRALEITMTTPGALKIIAAMTKQKSAGVVVGAGTVLSPENAAQAIDAGAEFIVSPVTNFGMIEVCRKHDVFVAPGAFTPTEILAAWEAGADVVKVFPATSVGPKYFKDIKGPLPQIRLMPTGGVSLENAREFIENGACCVGIGTALLDKKAIDSNNWDLLTQKAKALVESLAG